MQGETPDECIIYCRFLNFYEKYNVRFSWIAKRSNPWKIYEKKNVVLILIPTSSIYWDTNEITNVTENVLNLQIAQRAFILE